ncbi:hypothetical protein D3C72_2016400 [compost metagenome]
MADAEWQLLAHCALHVFEVDEDALSCLGTEVNRVRARFRDALECLKHQIKLANVRVIAAAAIRTSNFVLVDKHLHLVEGHSVDDDFDVLLTERVLD